MQGLLWFTFCKRCFTNSRSRNLISFYNGDIMTLGILEAILYMQ